MFFSVFDTVIIFWSLQCIVMLNQSLKSQQMSHLECITICTAQLKELKIAVLWTVLFLLSLYLFGSHQFLRQNKRTT